MGWSQKVDCLTYMDSFDVEDGCLDPTLCRWLLLQGRFHVLFVGWYNFPWNFWFDWQDRRISLPPNLFFLWLIGIVNLHFDQILWISVVKWHPIVDLRVTYTTIPLWALLLSAVLPSQCLSHQRWFFQQFYVCMLLVVDLTWRCYVVSV